MEEVRKKCAPWRFPAGGLLWAALSITSAPIYGATYWVDVNHPQASDANPGTEDRPWKTIQKAASAISGGDTVRVKAGIYEGFVGFSGKAGSQSSPTVIEAVSGGGPVVRRGLGVSGGRVKIENCSWLEFKGFEITNFNQGLRIEACSHITVSDVRVHHVGQEAVSAKYNSEYILFQNCTVHDTEQWDYNGEGFYIGTGSAGPLDNTHHVIVCQCVIYNTTDEAIEFKPGTHDCVAEGNVIHNAGTNINSRNYGVIEINESRLGVQDWPQNPRHIVRNNVVYDCTKSSAIRAGTGCSVYKNVVYGVAAAYYGICINKFDTYTHLRRICHNTVDLPATRAIVVQSGSADIRNNIGPSTVGNMAVNPVWFVSPPNYHLVPGAAPVDAGACLTTIATADGSGAAFQVADAGYFTDGWGGFAAVEGDVIQLLGTAQKARITSINFDTQWITLDRTVTWVMGQGISLFYTGDAPDVGAYELEDVNKVAGFDVQKGSPGRGFVRYVDVTFETADGLADLVPNNRVRLTRYELDGSGGAPVSLTGVVSVVGNQVSLDFGPKGIGADPRSTDGDGYYVLAFDLGGDGFFETQRRFYRLFGDVDRDRKVTAVDASLILSAYRRQGANLPTDVTGDGVVNALDRMLTIRSLNRKLADGLAIDD